MKAGRRENLFANNEKSFGERKWEIRDRMEGRLALKGLSLGVYSQSSKRDHKRRRRKGQEAQDNGS